MAQPATHGRTLSVLVSECVVPAVSKLWPVDWIEPTACFVSQWSKSAFYIFKWLKKIKRRTFCNMWKSHDIQIQCPSIKLHYNAGTPFHLCTVYSCSHAPMAELSSWVRDHLAHKAKNINYLYLYRKGLLIHMCVPMHTGTQMETGPRVWGYDTVWQFGFSELLERCISIYFSLRKHFKFLPFCYP